jgi:hypothetical protein
MLYAGLGLAAYAAAVVALAFIAGKVIASGKTEAERQAEDAAQTAAMARYSAKLAHDCAMKRGDTRTQNATAKALQAATTAELRLVAGK